VESRYIIGIDLGTTNCAVAYVDTHGGRDAPIHFLHIPQVVSPGNVENLSLLPSFSYQIKEKEFPEGSFDLPWRRAPQDVVGAYARERGAQVPDRVISSPKS